MSVMNDGSQGDDSELGHHLEQVRHAPVLGDLAVHHAHRVDGLDLNLLAGRGDAEELSGVRAAVDLVGGNQVAARGLPLDVWREVGEAGAQAL
jgi:hypothetical protein